MKYALRLSVHMLMGGMLFSVLLGAFVPYRIPLRRCSGVCTLPFSFSVLPSGYRCCTDTFLSLLCLYGIPDFSFFPYYASLDSFLASPAGFGP